MNDTDARLRNLQRYEETRIKLRIHNRRVIFEALAAAVISKVHVTFDGIGDSGQMDSVRAWRGEEIVILPDMTVSIDQIPAGFIGEYEPVTVALSLQEAVETLCYDCLDDEHGGWANNDGAFGEFRIDVAKGVIELEFNGRYTDFHTTKHTF